METFYEAFINCKHKVLGKRLKPFCLKHCLYLEAIGSPIMKVVNGEEAEITRKDLEIAVVICSTDRDILDALSRPYITMKFHRFKRGLTAFLGYLTDYLSLPEMWDRSNGKTTINSPWILSRVILLLSKTNLTREEVWSMPLGELLWYCASFIEQEGFGQIQSEEERKMIEEAEKIKNANK